MRRIKLFSLFQERVARRMCPSRWSARHRASWPASCGSAAVESLESRCLLAAGDLDPSFGVAGRVTTDVSPEESGGLTSAVAIQSDGKIIVASTAYNNANKDFAIVRYNSDGSLDSSFGTDGIVITEIGSLDDVANSVALQSDGKIVVAGKITNGNLALARYNADGSSDSSFDGDGMLTMTFGASSSVNTVAVQSDGKIVVAGGSLNFAVARFNSDGSLDASFDGDGKLTTNVGTSAVVNDMTLQSDGKIIVAGTVTEIGGDRVFALTRYNSDGSLDDTFDGDGKLITDLGGSNAEAKSVIVQPDGRILVVGYKSSGGNGNLALVRYESDGALDTSFDGDGILTTNFGIRNDFSIGIALQTDGKIVAATTPQFRSSFAVLRFNADGVLDLTFGPAGTVETDFDLSLNASTNGVVLQSDGKIVVVGMSNYELAVARYLSGAESLTPVDQPPSINSPNTAAVPENTTAVLSVIAVDPEGRFPLYGITGGTDQAKFSINSFTGALTFVAAPDFENPTDPNHDNIYEVQITASDGISLAQQTIAVTVTDMNEAPAITSASSANVAENVTTVLTVSGSDPEHGDLTYSLAGGADDSLFSLNLTTGGLAFLAAPNFESPQDADQNNVYEVRVSVSDGTNTATQDIQVTVTNVDETPSITSANAASVLENVTSVQTVTASDPEGHFLLYGITGGVDQAKFTLNFLTGALTFVSPPDFEHPTDSNHDNVYEVQVAVSDGTHLVTQEISVTVINVNETVTMPLPANGGNFKTLFLNGQLHLRSSLGKQLIAPVTLPSGADVQFDGTNAADRLTLDRSWSSFAGSLTFNGNGGNDQLDARTVSLGVTFNGGDGNDTLLGGRGDDTTNGGTGLDSLTGNDGNDSLTGGEGNDKLFGGADGDILAGDAGADSLSGGDDDDSLSGGDANDTLTGDAGNDTVTGDAGADSITGGDDDDLLVGGIGNDSIDGGRGEDVLDGGDDNDNLKGSDGNDAIRGGNGNDTLSGGNGDDLLTGSAGNDSLLGDAGTDTLLGDDGTDKLNGGLGTDTLNGVLTGPSKDTISDSTKVIDTSFAFDFDGLIAGLL